MDLKKIILWGSKTARTLRPIWIAEELEIEYELLPIGPRTGETLSEEYTKLNPKQKIPFMEHGDFQLSYKFDLPKNITLYRDKISERGAFKKAMKINFES